jgi:DNA polymerase/3'-5' exonuclease PolX
MGLNEKIEVQKRPRRVSDQPIMSDLDYLPLLLDALETLRKRELANKQTFKARAYQTVIQQLKALSGPITSYDEISHLKGMGEKIREKVLEVFETGKLAAAEKAKEVYCLSAHDELQQIYGIGPTKAKALIDQGIRSVSDLRCALESDPALLNDKQKIGLQYCEDLVQRIPREEMLNHEAYLLSHSPLPAELVGSFRRGSKDSGDIDVLLRVPPNRTEKEIKDIFYQFVQHLVEEGYIKEILALGDHKCMAICRFKDHPSRRLDLLVTPDDKYAYALLYFTGSDRFNVAFRQHVQEKGYTLNEHRMAPLYSSTLPPPYMKSEEDIFHFLGLEYTEPTERIDATSIRVKRNRIRKPVSAPSE